METNTFHRGTSMPYTASARAPRDGELETPEGRVTTEERNTWAWQQCFAALPEALASARGKAGLYVLVGAQGSGKSAWAKARKLEQPECVIFDAILVKRSQRAPILAEARRHGVPAVAVWFRTSLHADDSFEPPPPRGAT